MSQGDIGRQWESEPGITPAEVEAFASRLEIVAGRLKEVALLSASADDSDRLRAREALIIMDKYLADELAAFSKKMAQ
jgi:hypothetical protein